MLSVIEIYNDVVKDSANAVQNAHLGYEMFTRMSKRAELRLIDWLTGHVSGEQRPITYTGQKDKDWLSTFITPYEKQTVDGVLIRPDDYYTYDNLARIGARVDGDCEGEGKDECNTPITIMNGDRFNHYCTSYIKEIRPSLSNLIAKVIGNTFVIAPKDVGSVRLEYIRYPKFASIKPKIDPIFNDEVPDVVVDYEWGEGSREALIWFIVDTFADHTSNNAMKQFNQTSNPKKP